MKAFLSHSSSDKPLATKIYRHLRDYAVSVWFDKIEIRAGDSLMEKIGNGIDKSDFLIVLITKESNQSKWVHEEVSIARTQEIEGDGPKVIPLVVGNADVPPKLKSKLYFEIDGSGEGIDDIITAIFRNSLIMDLELNPDTLELCEESMKEVLYEFTRRQKSNIIIRVDNHNFTQKVTDVVSGTLDDPEISEPVARQVRRCSEMFEIELPLFWRNLAAILSNLLELLFNEYGKSLDAVKIAHKSTVRCFDYSQRLLSKKINPAVFANYANDFGHDGLAAYIERFDRNEKQREKPTLRKICNIPEDRSLVRCDLVESEDQKVRHQRILLPIENKIDKMELWQRRSPEVIITKADWFTLCVPQIFERALQWTSFREGKPLHEIPYKIGLQMSDYPAIGPS